MNKQEALNKLQSMSDTEFNVFFDTLPARVKILVRSGFVKWQRALPDWYIKYKYE